MSFEKFPAVIRSAMSQEGAFITDHGVAKKQASGGEELLVSFPGLTKQKFYMDYIGEQPVTVSAVQLVTEVKVEEKAPEVAPPVEEEAPKVEEKAPDIVPPVEDKVEEKAPEAPKVEEVKVVPVKGKPGPKPKAAQPADPAKESVK